MWVPRERCRGTRGHGGSVAGICAASSPLTGACAEVTTALRGVMHAVLSRMFAHVVHVTA